MLQPEEAESAKEGSQPFTSFAQIAQAGAPQTLFVRPPASPLQVATFLSVLKPADVQKSPTEAAAAAGASPKESTSVLATPESSEKTDEVVS